MEEQKKCDKRFIKLNFCQQGADAILYNIYKVFNPFPDEQLILDGHSAKTSLRFYASKYNTMQRRKNAVRQVKG